MKRVNATIKGVITAVLMISLSIVFFYVLRLPINGNNQYIILLLSVAGVLWSLFAFKKIAPQGAKFKDYFSEGFLDLLTIFFVGNF